MVLRLRVVLWDSEGFEWRVADGEVVRMGVRLGVLLVDRLVDSVVAATVWKLVVKVYSMLARAGVQEPEGPEKGVGGGCGSPGLSTEMGSG